MIGSIIGDIVGSIYEFGNIKTKDFEFLSDKCSFTDDSVLTVATAEWILNGVKLLSTIAVMAMRILGQWEAMVKASRYGSSGQTVRVIIVLTTVAVTVLLCALGLWDGHSILRKKCLLRQKKALNVPTTIRKESKAHRLQPYVS